MPSKTSKAEVEENELIEGVGEGGGRKHWEVRVSVEFRVLVGFDGCSV